MRTVSPDTHLVRDGGPFRLRRVRPGVFDNTPVADAGFGGLGLIDHARLSPGLVVPMHEHRDDEIVSYLRVGSMEHTDTAGHRELVRPDRLMVMNAGSGFSHEERVPAGPVEMLQIFIRPAAESLPPQVQFVDLGEAESPGRWRLLVGPPGAGAPAAVRQEVFLFDARIAKGETLAVPTEAGFDPWLYVFSGRVRVGAHVLTGGWAVAADPGELPAAQADAPADLVLFLVDRAAPASRAGSFNRHASATTNGGIEMSTKTTLAPVKKTWSQIDASGYGPYLESLRMRLLLKLWEDPGAKKAFLADPKGVLTEETELRLPAGVRVEATEDTDTLFSFVLPVRPPEAEFNHRFQQIADWWMMAHGFLWWQARNGVATDKLDGFRRALGVFIIGRSWQDKAFVPELRKDAKGRLERELGATFPPGLRVQALVDTDDTVHVVLPKHPKNEGLVGQSDHLAGWFAAAHQPWWWMNQPRLLAPLPADEAGKVLA